MDPVTPTQALLDLPGVELLLPPRVWVLSLWHAWAACVAAGIKTIETRKWPWPYGRSWLAIHASKRADGDVEGRIVSGLPPVEPVTPGALCALVWVEGCRPLVPADLERALCYSPLKYAWPLSQIQRLKPVPMRGPQKLARVSREVILGALTGPVRA